MASLRRAHLKLKPSKCSLLRSVVSFLGHAVSANGIAIDPDKIKTVLECKRNRREGVSRALLVL